MPLPSEHNTSYSALPTETYIFKSYISPIKQYNYENCTVTSNICQQKTILEKLPTLQHAPTHLSPCLVPVSRFAHPSPSRDTTSDGLAT